MKNVGGKSEDHHFTRETKIVSAKQSEQFFVEG